MTHADSVAKVASALSPPQIKSLLFPFEWEQQLEKCVPERDRHTRFFQSFLERKSGNLAARAFEKDVEENKKGDCLQRGFHCVEGAVKILCFSQRIC